MRPSRGGLAGAAVIAGLLTPAGASALAPDVVIGPGLLPNAVNDAGQVALAAHPDPNDTTGASVQSYRWDPDGTGSGKLTALRALDGQAQQSNVIAMNESGESAGNSTLSVGHSTTATFWTATGSPVNVTSAEDNTVGPPDNKTRAAGYSAALAVGPDGTPGGMSYHCRDAATASGQECFDVAAIGHGRGSQLALITQAIQPTVYYNSPVSSINAFGDAIDTSAIFYSNGALTNLDFNGQLIFDNGAAIGQSNSSTPGVNGGSYGIYRKPDGTESIAYCGSSETGGNEYGDIGSVFISATNGQQDVWHNGSCYPLERVAPPLLKNWTFPYSALIQTGTQYIESSGSAPGPRLNAAGQIATMAIPPGGGTAQAVFFTPVYPTALGYVLSGKVTSSAGVPDPNVNISVLESDGTQVTPQVASSPNGSYSTSLSPGTYKVSAGAPGSHAVLAGSDCTAISAGVCTVTVTNHNLTASFGGATATGGGPSSGGGPGTGGAPGTGGGAGTGGGTSGAGPAPGGTSGLPAGGSAVSRPRLAKLAVRGSTVNATIGCPTAGPSCRVTLTLSVTETVRSGKLLAISARARLTRRTVVVGSASATIAPGRSATVRVALNAAGRRLLSGRRRPAARFTLARVDGRRTTRVLTRTVTLSVATRRRR